MSGKVDRTQGWDPNGAVVSAEGFSGSAPMLAGDPIKSVTLSQYAQMWQAGQEGMLGSALRGPDSPFRQSVWFNACVTAITTNAARVPLRLAHGEATGTRAVWGAKGVRTGSGDARVIRREKALRAIEGEIVETGDLFDLTTRPNPEQTWREFFEESLVYLYVYGRVHWLYDEMIGRRPISMYAIPGHKSRPVVDKSGRVARLKGWLFRDPNGIEYPVTIDECVTFTIFNPDNRYKGLSPREPAHLAIVSDYNASLYNAAMFANSCEPGTILETDAPFNPELDKQIDISWQQRHRGAINARKLAILWGGLKHKSVSQTLREMVFPQGKQLSREELCAVLRTPASVAGFFGTTGNSSAYLDEEMERFWQDTIVTLLDKFIDAINVHIAPRFPGGLEAFFDVQDVPTFQKMRRARFATAKDMAALTVPMADIIEQLDLGLPHRPHYDVAWVSVSVIPADQAVSGHALPPVDEGPPDDNSDDLAQVDEPLPADRQGRAATGIEKRAAENVWQAWMRSWAPLAKRCAGQLRNNYAAQSRKVVRLLKEYWPYPTMSADGAAVKDPTYIARILFEVFDDADEKAKFTARMQRIGADAQELGFRQTFSEAGLSAAEAKPLLEALPANPRITAALQSDAIRISTRINAFTRNHLRRHLTEGMEAGESVLKLADRVQNFMNNRRDAALSVARNTVGQTLSRARREGSVAAGMTHKIWLHSRGPGERRPAHVAAEAAYGQGKAIPIAQPFMVNGVPLMHPRDTSGPPAETVNCQCLAIYQRGADPGKSPVAFYTYADMVQARKEAA